MSAATTSDRRRLALLLAACISGAVLTLLGLRARTDAILAWDERVHAWLRSYAEPDEFNATADNAVGLLLKIGADLVTLTVLLVAAPWLAALRRFRDAWFLLSSVCAAALLTYLLKGVFARDPLSSYGKYELPSGHAARSVAVAGALLALTWRTRWRWPAAAAGGLFVAAVGASLVYEDWHLPSDVLAGWALAVLVLAATGAAFLRRPSLYTPAHRGARPERQGEPDGAG